MQSHNCNLPSSQPSSLTHHYMQLTVHLWPEDCPNLAGRQSYITLIARLKAFTLFKTALDNPTVFCPSVVWKSCSSHDFTGLAGCCTTRHCCSWLQYFNSIFQIFKSACFEPHGFILRIVRNM